MKLSKASILKKAIQKAIKNGWESELTLNGKLVNCVIDGAAMDGIKISMQNRRNDKWVQNFYYHPFAILFNHDFAKAFWGEEDVCKWCGKPPQHKEEPVKNPNMREAFGKVYKYDDCDCYDSTEEYSYTPTEAWIYHLEEMVLKRDPIEYIRKFI